MGSSCIPWMNIPWPGKTFCTSQKTFSLFHYIFHSLHSLKGKSGFFSRCNSTIYRLGKIILVLTPRVVARFNGRFHHRWFSHTFAPHWCQTIALWRFQHIYYGICWRFWETILSREGILGNYSKSSTFNRGKKKTQRHSTMVCGIRIGTTVTHLTSMIGLFGQDPHYLAWFGRCKGGIDMWANLEGL